MGGGASKFFKRRNSAAAVAPAPASRDVADGALSTYPPGFAAELASLARDAGDLCAGDEAKSAEVDEGLQLIIGMDVLQAAACGQLRDLALAAGHLAAVDVLKQEGAEARKEAWQRAAMARPERVGQLLWQRTGELCTAASRWACAERAGEAGLAAREERAFKRHCRAVKGFGPGKGPKDAEAYAARAGEVMPATVIMFSGCQDCQTSADVQNTASFGLPADAGPGGAGGACTNAMIKALHEKEERSWAELLAAMRGILQGGYTQIPQLSSSKQVDLGEKFGVVHGESSGRFRALMVGINYPGTSAELRGCHNDVETMRRYIEGKGYPAGDTRLLLDDGAHELPSRHNIEEGLKWLVEGAEAGDSLFFHYSGHGASVRDDNGEEADGKDEALCPGDYESAGLLRDDEVFRLLVAPLKAGVKLTCVLDCCHSGTILDLPYIFKADTASLAAVEAAQQGGAPAMMLPNPGFDFGKVLQVLKDHPLLVAGAAAVGGVALMAMGKEHRSRAMGMLGGQEQLLGMAAKHLGANEQLLGLAQSFLS